MTLRSLIPTLLGGNLLIVSAADVSVEAVGLLKERCFSCHGPSRSENALRLDLRAEAIKGGDHGTALVPGKPGESLMVKVVTGSTCTT